jgi:hypothetical protein
VYAVATERPSTATARADNLRPLPPGLIPSPRREDPSESLPTGHRSRRNVIVAGFAVLAAGAGLTVLLGHGAPASGAPTPAATVQRSSADVGYLKTVHEQVDFATTSDDSLIRTGHLLCDRLRGGASPDQIALASVGKPYSVEDVSTALGAAVGAYCPDQMARVGTIG